jgi:hypothetical protein
MTRQEVAATETGGARPRLRPGVRRPIFWEGLRGGSKTAAGPQGTGTLALPAIPAQDGG